MEIKQGYDGGKVAGREKGEERDVWMYEGNTDGGITADKDPLDLFVWSVIICRFEGARVRPLNAISV